MTKAYDRQEGETTKAYSAFTIYRDMGATRSLEKTAGKFYTPDSPQKRPRNITQIEVWSRIYHWIDRCRKYDLDQERERKQIKSEHEKAAYIKDLEHYHSQQKMIGMNTLNFTARSLDAISFILEPIHEAIQESKALTDRQINVLFSSQISAKNLMVAAKLGAEMTAKGLVIAELMAVIESEIDARSGQI
jgi:hypothetical protein